LQEIYVILRQKKPRRETISCKGLVKVKATNYFQMVSVSVIANNILHIAPRVIMSEQRAQWQGWLTTDNWQLQLQLITDGPLNLCCRPAVVPAVVSAAVGCGAGACRRGAPAAARLLPARVWRAPTPEGSARGPIDESKRGVKRQKTPPGAHNPKHRGGGTETAHGAHPPTHGGTQDRERSGLLANSV